MAFFWRSLAPAATARSGLRLRPAPHHSLDPPRARRSIELDTLDQCSRHTRHSLTRLESRLARVARRLRAGGDARSPPVRDSHFSTLLSGPRPWATTLLSRLPCHSRLPPGTEHWHCRTELRGAPGPRREFRQNTQFLRYRFTPTLSDPPSARHDFGLHAWLQRVQPQSVPQCRGS